MEKPGCDGANSAINSLPEVDVELGFFPSLEQTPTYANEVTPQTFDSNTLFEEANVSCNTRTVISTEAEGCFESEFVNSMTKAFVDDFRSKCQSSLGDKSYLESSCCGHSSPEESYQWDTSSSFLDTECVPYLPPPILKNRLKQPINLQPLDYERVLDGWLNPVGYAKNKLKATKTLMDFEKDLGQKATEEFRNKDEYFENWCKYYTRVYLKASDSQLTGGNWLQKSLDVLDPSSQYQIYHFKQLITSSDPLMEIRDGLVAFEKGDMLLAIYYFEKSLIEKPNNPNGWYLLGRAQSAAGNDDLAICALMKCLRLDFSRAEVYLALASSFVNEGLFSSACRMLCFWLFLHEIEHSEAYQKISKQRFSFFSLDKMLTSTVGRSDLKSLLDIFLEISSANAEKTFEKTSNKMKNDTINQESFNSKTFCDYPEESLVDPALNTCLALLYIMNNMLPEAATRLSGAIQVDGKDPTLWNKLGTVMAHQGKYAEAIEFFKSALNIWPGYLKVRTNVSTLCKKLRLYKESAEHLLEIMERLEYYGAVDESYWRRLENVFTLMYSPKPMDHAIYLFCDNRNIKEMKNCLSNA